MNDKNGETKSSRFHTSDIITISVAHFFHDVYTSFLAPILPLLIEKLGISYSLAGLLDVFRKLPSLFNPFVGILADNVSMRYFVIFAPAITSVCMSLLGITSHYVILAVLLFITGISSTLFHVPAPVMIKNIAGNRVGKGMSFFMLGGELARTLGPLIIIAAISLWKLEGTFRLMPFGILASAILFFKLKNLKVEKIAAEEKKRIGIKHTFFALLPFFSVIMGIAFFRAMMKSALTIFLPTFMVGKGATLWLGGASLSIIQLTGAVGTSFSGTISDKIGRVKVLLIISIITPILMLFFINSSGILAIIILLITGFFLFSSGPVLLAVIQDIKTERPAFVNGIYMGINFVISSIAVMLIGFFGDLIGLEKTFKIAAIISLAGIPFILILPKTKKEEGEKNGKNRNSNH